MRIALAKAIAHSPETCVINGGHQRGDSVMQDAAMLWTGGKDSAMALYEARQEGYRVRCLVTFAPPDAAFRAHPLDFIRMQARSLDLPHRVLSIVEPFDGSYEARLRQLIDEMGIDQVVTGDIALVGGSPNWIRERSRAVGMNVYTPLWGRDRETLLRQLLERGFRARVSCVNTRWLDESWVGRELDEAAIAELRFVRRQTGLDLSGEEGEYHTLVVDGPQFRQGIQIRSCSTATVDSLAYLDIGELELTERRVISP